MPIHFACPRCAGRLSVATRKAGSEVTCPGCGQVVIVPTPPSQAQPGIPIEPGPPPPTPPRPTPPQPPPPCPTPPDEPDAGEDDEPPRRESDEDYDPLPIRRHRRKHGAAPFVLFGVGFLALVTLIMVVAAVIRSDRAAQHNAKATAKQPATGTQSRTEPVRNTPSRVPDDPSDGDEIGRKAAGFGSLLCVGVVVVLLIVSAILMAVWVIQDCRNRSVENGFLWMFLIMGTHFVGLLVYLASRPHGSLIRCERCGNKRLAFVGVCPHCGRPVKARGRVS